MTATFNLMDEPWIPCVLLESGERREFSLRDALAHAAEIREIGDPSPLVTVSLHRLLLAILHRNFGPDGPASWYDLWSKGVWDGDKLAGYLDTWRSRFDLFSNERPFYQAASLSFEYEKPIAMLTHELASPGNPTTLFDHTANADLALLPGLAARYVVARQSFSLGGLVSLEKGQDIKLYKSADAAPLVKGAVVLVKGANLFETLMLNLHAYTPELPFERDHDDRPAWERESETVAGDRYPTGYLDLLTWQSRRIRLHPSQDATGCTVVRHVVVMKGSQFPDGYSQYRKEPMLAFRINKDAKAGQDPNPMLGLQRERAIWRDSHVLFQSMLDPNAKKESSARPMMLDWLSDLVAAGYLDRTRTLPLDLHGMHTDPRKPAVVLFWRHERLPLPLVYLDDKDLFDKLRAALGLAEVVARNLRACVWLLAKLTLAPESNDNAARQPASEDVSRLADSIDPTRFYWARLQFGFMELLRDLVDDRAERGGMIVYGETIVMPAWAGELRRTAWAAFEDITRGMDASARSLKAIPGAERRLNGLLYETLKDYATQAQGGAA